MKILSKKKNWSLWNFVRIFILEEKAGSMVESGLLIGFAILIFFLLLSTVETIYTWIDQNLTGLINQVKF